MCEGNFISCSSTWNNWFWHISSLFCPYSVRTDLWCNWSCARDGYGFVILWEEICPSSQSLFFALHLILYSERTVFSRASGFASLSGNPSFTYFDILLLDAPMKCSDFLSLTGYSIFVIFWFKLWLSAITDGFPSEVRFEYYFQFHHLKAILVFLTSFFIFLNNWVTNVLSRE